MQFNSFVLLNLHPLTLKRIRVESDKPAASVTDRLIVLQSSFELPQSHVGGGAAVVAFNVVLVHLQGLGSVRQGVAIALGAQVGQAAVAVVDGVGRIELQSL